MKLADRFLRALVTFDDRLFRALVFDDEVDEGTLLTVLSPESIKHLFDSIRNFALVAVVGAAGVFFLARAPSLLERGVSYLFLIAALALFGLNVVFVWSLFSRLRIFHHRRGWVVLVGLAVFLTVTLAGMFLVFTVLLRSVSTNG